MQSLTASQAKHLRGLAHSLKPIVFVGQKGVTPGVLASVREALDLHELIKVKFQDLKDRALKAQWAAQIEQATDCRLAGLIGHTAILYRQQPDPDRRRIALPAAR
jgi:RNA-binding protein